MLAFCHVSRFLSLCRRTPNLEVGGFRKFRAYGLREFERVWGYRFRVDKLKACTGVQDKAFGNGLLDLTSAASFVVQWELKARSSLGFRALRA